MEVEQFKKVVNEICEFLEEHGIENEMNAVCSEKEWTDFRLTIKDLNQMNRINIWFQDDLKQAIIGWTDIEVAAPNPLQGKEDELRIRVYESLTAPLHK